MNPTFTVEGLDRAVIALATLPRKIRNKSLRKAFSRGATPCAKAIRRNTRRDTGTAKRNVGSKIIVKGDKDPKAIIGHKRLKNLGRGQRNPANYSHLMERGAKAHAIYPRAVKAVKFTVGKRGGGATLYRRRISHPGAPPQRVIETSFSESRGQAVSTVIEVLRASIPGDVR